MRIALKFGYDGSRFWGYQRQTNVRTVEGDIIKALEKTKIIRDVKHSKFQSSSRTDRGASAIGNVLAFDTEFRGLEILGALNSNLEDIYFWGIAEVADDFNPRYARQRWYRYHIPGSKRIGALKEASAFFEGEHDFKAFCRKSERSTIRKIESIQLKRGKFFIHFDIKAPSFLWNMVRRIVSAVVKCADGDVSRETLTDALAGKGGNLGLAPAEPLFLMDVSYDFEFGTRTSSIPSLFYEKYHDTRIQTELYEDMEGMFR